MKTKAKYLGLIFLLICVCSVFFACNKNIDVKSISFKENNIVLLVGEEYNPEINIYPTNATNKEFEFTSLNNEVVSVNGKTLTAIGEGSTIIKVTSKDNANVEDVLTVKVVNASSTLLSPEVAYDAVTKSFKISPIFNASGYTLKINEDLIELNSKTEFYLKDYAQTHSAFDVELTVQARANAADYSKAFLSSDFGEAIKIYQASEITNAQILNGKLNFTSNEENNFYIYIDDQSYGTVERGEDIDLTTLPTEYAGSEVELKVQAVFGGKKKTGVTYFASNFVSLPLSVLDVVNFSVAGSTLYISPILNADEYAIYLDGAQVALTSDSEFDLSTSAQFNEITDDKISKITVKAKIKSGEKNVGSTSGVNTLNISRKAEINLTATNNLITWPEGNSVELTLSYDTVTEPSIITSFNQFDLNDYDANTYTLKIISLGGMVGDVYYLPSNQTQIEITKQQQVEISSENIENQVLTFAATALNFKVLLDEKVVAGTIEDGKYTVDFKTQNLTSGNHTVYITRLGNGTNIFDSNTTTVSFVQLEAIESVEINDGVASFVCSSINKNAQITAKITRTIDSGIKNINVVNNSFELESETDDFYTAGDYKIEMFVKGDDSTTFSVLSGQEVKPTCSKDFSVLAAPELKIDGASAAEITFESTAAEQYKIFVSVVGNFNELSTLNKEQTSFEFEILNGQTKTYKIQAIGNGQEILNSKLSDELVLTRLNAPILTYNFSQNKLEVNAINSEELLFSPKYTITLNDTPFDEQNIANELSLNDGTNTVTIFANAIDEKDGVHYLNSTITSLEIEKLFADATYKMLDSYRLEISTSNSGNYKILVKFTIDGEERLFYENGNNLTCDEIEKTLPLTKLGNRFIVDLLNNYQPILEVNSSLNVNV